MGQAVAPEEGHEGTREGCDALPKGFQCGFATGGIPQQQRDEVAHLIVTHAPAGHPDVVM